MNLKKFLNNRKEDICILMFNEEDEIEPYFYKYKDRNKIPEYMLNMEYMDSEKESDGILEVWIR